MVKQVRSWEVIYNSRQQRKFAKGRALRKGRSGTYSQGETCLKFIVKLRGTLRPSGQRAAPSFLALQEARTQKVPI